MHEQGAATFVSFVRTALIKHTYRYRL